MPRPLTRPPALDREPPPLGSPTLQPGLRLSLPLETITPVIGGGVTPFEPDSVDGVRVPSIRGALREWWRLLFRRQHESAESLFQREAALWGGVGVDAASRGTGATKSRVQITVEVTSWGDVRRAGVHKPSDGTGRLKALPDWEIGPKLGYALFPLQRQQEERDHHAAGGDLATRSVRLGAAFQLTATLRGSLASPGELSQARQLLATLWMWVHFGGLGARTRRGFGAVDLAPGATLDARPELDCAGWRKLYDSACKEDLPTRLGRLQEHTGEPALLRRVGTILVSSTPFDSAGAHQAGVDLLKTFRQGKGVGRDPAGSTSGHSHAGRSRWPEPDLLRLVAQRDHGARGWDHEPRTQPEELPQLGAPRAAFGLPLVMHFKTARGRFQGDAQADAELYPWLDGRKLERWVSPLIVRPLRWGPGDYRSGLVVLDQPAPAEVQVILDQEKGLNQNPGRTVSRARPQGSRGDIKTLLVRHSGEALEAFCQWAVSQGYQPVSPHATGGAHHA